MTDRAAFGPEDEKLIREFVRDWVCDGTPDEMEPPVQAAFRLLSALDLASKAAPSGGEEPVFWVYDLATGIEADGKTYTNWERRFSAFKPTVPERSIRNLVALYASPSPVAGVPEGMVVVSRELLTAIKEKLRLYHNARKMPHEHVGGAHVQNLLLMINAALSATPAPASPPDMTVRRRVEGIVGAYITTEHLPEDELDSFVDDLTAEVLRPTVPPSSPLPDREKPTVSKTESVAAPPEEDAALAFLLWGPDDGPPSPRTDREKPAPVADMGVRATEALIAVTAKLSMRQPGCYAKAHEAMESALTTVEREALERAAKVADEAGRDFDKQFAEAKDSIIRIARSASASGAYDVALKIRSLTEKGAP